MAEMIVHEGRRYRRDDAIKAGVIKAEPEVKVDEPADPEPATKVVEPEVKKVREPATTKSRTSDSQ